MPIAFLCSQCGHKLRGPDQPGRKVRCPQCGAVVTIPDADGIAIPELEAAAVQPGPAVPSWEADPPPVRAGLPPAAPPAQEPAAPERVTSVSFEREPWFYRFLVAYAKVVFWISLIGLALCGLGLLLTVFLLAMTKERYLVDAVMQLVYWLLILLAVIFWVATVLLAVDVARNLRTMRQIIQDRSR